ncbi:MULTISPECIES: hypothetical protein [unclassified Sphingobacterium]|uniref:hypothetical protein n=1 Tax=unclassified Sphingobacterium TaxID=2609468 RepID=UPI0025D046BF|nr:MULTISPECIES: hypothetical protein [unclassified Sphingobacterium]
MNLQILSASQTSDWKSFIDFWSSMYFYKLEDVYNSRINKEIFEEEDLLNFYIWKNGSVLSKPKQKSFETKIIANLTHINSAKLNKHYKFSDHIEKYKDISAVWSIFLLHLIQPNKFPIYDQHIHRAFVFITGIDDYRKIDGKASNKSKFEFYSEKYLPFIEENLKDFDLKKIDEAFFAFGQFLKTKRYDNVFLKLPTKIIK